MRDVVFGGDAISRKLALEALQTVQVGFSSTWRFHEKHVEIQLLSMGKPKEYYSSYSFLKDWPRQAFFCDPLMLPAISMFLHALHKRQYEDNRVLGDPRKVSKGWMSIVPVKSLCPNVEGLTP
jgi:hypothetical protein